MASGCYIDWALFGYDAYNASIPILYFTQCFTLPPPVSPDVRLLS
jgi:hypothetical protein